MNRSKLDNPMVNVAVKNAQYASTITTAGHTRRNNDVCVVSPTGIPGALSLSDTELTFMAGSSHCDSHKLPKY
jgi:hypothetical protein